MPSPSLSALLRERLRAVEDGAPLTWVADTHRYIALAEALETDARLLADALGNVLGGAPERALDLASIHAAIERRRSREGGR